MEQKRSLVDQKAVLEFIHEAEEVTEWIDSQMVVSGSFIFIHSFTFTYFHELIDS